MESAAVQDKKKKHKRLRIIMGWISHSGHMLGFDLDIFVKGHSDGKRNKQTKKTI